MNESVLEKHHFYLVSYYVSSKEKDKNSKFYNAYNAHGSCEFSLRKKQITKEELISMEKFIKSNLESKKHIDINITLNAINYLGYMSVAEFTSNNQYL